jgi:hypothetical protein
MIGCGEQPIVVGQRLLNLVQKNLRIIVVDQVSNI